MKSRFKVIWCLFLIFLFTSCSTTYRVSYSQDKLDSYIGMTHHQLVRLLGAPMAEISDGGNGYILVFEGNSEIFDYSSRYVAHSSTLPKAEFYMNSDGICYQVRTANTDPVTSTNVGLTIFLLLLLIPLFI